ncbi:MAG: trypsin-like peptidase domain-containing protein [Burkholderiales bacterium]
MGRLGWTALLALMPVTLQAADRPEPNYIARISLSVVKVHAHSAQGKTGFGSGVMVGPGEVATNCHVTRDAESISVRKGGIWLAVQAQRANPGRDLCLLTVPDTSPIPVAPMRSVSEAAPGQTVYSVSFPGGAGSMFASGRIHGLHGFDGSRVIETTTGFNLGSSGGALFDDEGRLLGLTTFRARGSRDNHFYAIPSDWIEELRQQPAQAVAPLGTVLQPFWSEARARQPYFLQAVPLESEEDWEGLQRVAGQWSRVDPGDADAWYFLGRAQMKLNHPDAAVPAFQRAVELNPEFGRAWLELGLLYARLGRTAELERVRVSLMSVDEDLEQELVGALGGI